MTRSKPYPDQARTLGALLRAPYQYLLDNVYGQLASQGHTEIRPAHSSVFRHIVADGSRIKNLAAHANMTKQSMAALVEHLEQHGYVSIGPDPSDGRAKRVVLTEKGVGLQLEAARLSRLIERRWSRSLGEDGMAELRTQLERLYDLLNGEENA